MIDRIGQRGDGVVEGGAEPIFVFGALPGETVEVEDIPGHPDRRQLLRVDKPSAERIAPICPHFGVCGGCAVQHWQTEHYRVWKRDLVVTALRQAGIEAPVGDLIDARWRRSPPRRVSRQARRRDIRGRLFGRRALSRDPIDRCPVLGPKPRRRAAMPHGRLPSAGAAKAARHPGHRDRYRPRCRRARLRRAVGFAHGGTGASPPLTPGAPDPSRRACRAAARADGADRQGDGGAAARRISASHRGRRTGARALALAIAPAPKRSPTCSPASARSRCGSPKARASSRSTPTRRRSARSRLRRRPRPASSRSTSRDAICSKVPS